VYKCALVLCIAENNNKPQSHDDITQLFIKTARSGEKRYVQMFLLKHTLVDCAHSVILHAADVSCMLL